MIPAISSGLRFASVRRDGRARGGRAPRGRTASRDDLACVLLRLGVVLALLRRRRGRRVRDGRSASEVVTGGAATGARSRGCCGAAPGRPLLQAAARARSSGSASASLAAPAPPGARARRRSGPVRVRGAAGCAVAPPVRPRLASAAAWAAARIASETSASASEPRPAAVRSCSAPCWARARIAPACARAHSSVCSTSARAAFVNSVAWWRDCSSSRAPRASASRSSAVASRFEFASSSRDSALAAFTISLRWRSLSSR